MRVEKIKTRSVVFTYNAGEWDLNLHLILGNKYNYIIDTGLGSHSVEPIKAYIKDDNKPVIVINTHYHWDHIWGNHYFQDSMIVSHRICREIIQEKWAYMLDRNKRYIDGEAVICLPNLVFEEEIYFPEDKIRLIYTPGHTIDSISVIDEEDGVMNAGDNIGDNLEEIVPSIGADMEQYLATLRKYQKLDFDTCISGHNVVLGKDVIEKILGIVVTE